jgi:hypothetical protein
MKLLSTQSSAAGLDALRIVRQNGANVDVPIFRWIGGRQTLKTRWFVFAEFSLVFRAAPMRRWPFHHGH